MITVLTVDDEKMSREYLRNLLSKDAEFELVGECSNGRAAVDAILKKRPHVVFLDVRMPMLDGFEVIKTVGTKNMPLTVFTTAYDEFALTAFEAEALDYLLKPFNEKRFRQTLARIKRQLAATEPDVFAKKVENLLALASPHFIQRIAIKSGGRIVFINVNEIRWIEAAGNYLKIYTEAEAHTVRDSLASLEQRLEPKRFLRIHRSTIVNVDQIKEMKPWYTGEYIVVMNGDKELTLSRGYRSQLARLMHLDDHKES